MPFEGSIKELSLFDLFQLLSLSQKTGTLIVKNEEGEVEIFFREGRIIAVKKETFIREKKEAQEVIFFLLDTTKGYFSFSDSIIPDGLKEDFSLRVDNLILEASRRIDELAKIKKSLPSKTTQLMLSTKATNANRLDLTSTDWEIISYVDGVRNIGEIIEIMGNEYDTKKHIYGLMKAGLLTTGKQVYKEKKEEVPKDPKKILLDTANELYLNREFAASKSILRKIVSLYPEEKEILYNLVLAMIRTGEFLEAKEISEKLLVESGGFSKEKIEELDNVLNTILKFVK